jgi:hypothetical protein
MKALFAALLLLSACSTLPARERDFDPALCNRNAAYEAGFNDGNDGREMGSTFLHRCREDLRAQGQEGYMTGYESGRKRYEERIREMNARQQTDSATPATPPTPPSSVNTHVNHGVEINIGGARDSSHGANPRAWYCNVNAFMDEFEAFGPTQLEARQLAIQQCVGKHHAMHCKDAKCQLNQ